MNSAASYGVEIEPTQETGRVWRAVEVRHLSPEENRGKQNIFVDVVDETGRRVRGNTLRIAYQRSSGQTIAFAMLDKSDGPMERGDGVVDIYKHDTIRLWISAPRISGASDIVSGIHSRHDDEPGPNGENWNSWGHHSFYVKFQLTNGTPVVEPPPVVKSEVEQAIDEIDRAWAKLKAAIRGSK
ncbi:MAG: hypothetical protein KDE47_32850 [Caldilineaceae bacterium]|nr:hypothetical protein [Caldilineaceae bacterium]